MSGDIAALSRSELEALVVDMAKTQERYRRAIANIVRDFEDEGDRVYLGSTNDADELRDLDEKLTNTLNWLGCEWMHGADLWADLRQLRKEKAEAATALTDLQARLEAERAEVAKLREALGELIGAVDDLIADSGGVYGLHMNGDPAPWGELTEGGRFEGWLLPLERARATLGDER